MLHDAGASPRASLARPTGRAVRPRRARRRRRAAPASPRWSRPGRCGRPTGRTAAAWVDLPRRRGARRAATSKQPRRARPTEAWPRPGGRRRGGGPGRSATPDRRVRVGKLRSGLYVARHATQCATSSYRAVAPAPDPGRRGPRQARTPDGTCHQPAGRGPRGRPRAAVHDVSGATDHRGRPHLVGGGRGNRAPLDHRQATVRAELDAYHRRERRRCELPCRDYDDDQPRPARHSGRPHRRGPARHLRVPVAVRRPG